MNEIPSISKVLKNTIALYFRMIFLTLISLFTVRVILRELGAVDYGIYNVVGGFVSLLGFFSGTLAHMAQRFFAVYLARREWEMLQKIFSANLLLNIGMAFMIFLVAETVGVWFIIHELQIPDGRQTAVIWVYECSVITFLAALLSTPFQAVLIAEENMGIYSLISIIEGLFKLVTVYCLVASSGDKLVLYAMLLCAISLGINGFYMLYSRYKYFYVRFSICQEKMIYQDIFSFSGWNLIGALATLLRNQGVNILMNLFFGPVINAARGIAFQINGVISSFAQNFMTAVDPQIIKTYANKDFNQFNFWLFFASKISGFLLLLLIIPFSLNVNYILHFWLGEVPAFTAWFTVFVLAEAVIENITGPVSTAVQAIGKVRKYQIIVGGISLLNFPLTYGLLSVHENPLLPFAVSIGVSVIMGMCRLQIFHGMYTFSLKEYLEKVIGVIVIVTILTLSVGLYFFSGAETFKQLVGYCCACIVTSLIVIWYGGMNHQERLIVKKIIHNKGTV